MSASVFLLVSEIINTCVPEFRACFKKQLYCTLRPKTAISFLIFLSQNPPKMFFSSLKNYNDLFLVIDYKSSYSSYFSPTFHDTTPYFFKNLHFIPHTF